MSLENREAHFEFGANWRDYARTVDKTRIDLAIEGMRKLLPEGIAGKTFLDIGCGSGLHALAALSLGAASVVAIDIDENSVSTTRELLKKYAPDKNWKAEIVSVFDASPATLGSFDVVYSWGVLHHTGDVWRAIRNAAGRVPPNGLFYIALYAADVQKPPYTAQFWLDIKQRYLKASWLGKRRLEWWYIWTFYLGKEIKRLPEFIKRVRDYRKNRGMDIMADLRDWLGGWPMEFVWDADATKFCEQLGLKLEKIKAGEANTEFLFRRVD